jgi:uncharacterized metal-binding protein
VTLSELGVQKRNNDDFDPDQVDRLLPVIEAEVKKLSSVEVPEVPAELGSPHH